MHQWLDYKEEVNNLDLNFIHPNLFLILGFISKYCHDNNINLVISSIIRTPEENKKLGAVSKTHIEGRAIDISLRKEHGWTYEKIQNLVNDLNYITDTECYMDGRQNPFYQIGAISKSDKRQRVIVVHKNHTGLGDHAHIQVRQTNEWRVKQI